MSEKVLVAMSGGVDSSVAAYLVKDNGYNTSGATMRLYDKYPSYDNRNLNDINDAKSVCESLGMDFHIFDMRKEFMDNVISRFVTSYEKGDTPNPCIVCNKYMKFGMFLEAARSLGYDMISTGHYAGIDKINDRYYLKKAADDKKDQTYFLYSLTQNQLSRILFPLGELTKDEIRTIASKQSFVSAHKSDSQDICFVPNGEYVSLIKSISNKNYPQGDFVDIYGNKIGTHLGIINYTIGQRKGLGQAFGEKMYVKDKNTQTNEVTLAKNHELFSDSLEACDLNWIVYDEPPAGFRAYGKIRYAAKAEPCTVHIVDNDKIHVKFDSPQRAIAKGQAIVFYDDDIVIGGGTII